METEQLLVKYLESNSQLMQKTNERLDKQDDTLQEIREKVIHLEALAVKEKMNEIEQKVSSNTTTLERLKVYGVMIMTAISAGIAGAVNYLFKG